MCPGVVRCGVKRRGILQQITALCGKIQVCLAGQSVAHCALIVQEMSTESAQTDTADVGLRIPDRELQQ